MRDREGHPVDLRDRAGYEGDFLVTHRACPWFAVDVKLPEIRVDPAIVYFRDRLAIPSTHQVTLEGCRDYVENRIRVFPASTFLSGLV